MFHLLINGRPLCQHTACQAGNAQWRAVRGQPTCGQGDVRGAEQAARAWQAAHPFHAVAIGLGECPVAAGDDLAA